MLVDIAAEENISLTDLVIKILTAPFVIELYVSTSLLTKPM